MGNSRVRVLVLLLSSFFSFLLIQPASAVQISEFNESNFESFLPIIVAFAIAIPIWRWFIPTQLSNLQVAFEIDDDLYEVHKIT